MHYLHKKTNFKPQTPIAMNTEYIIGIVISLLLSANGFIMKMFVSSVKELKKAIQELSLSINGSQKDIEFLYRNVEHHEKILEKHTEDIEELKLKKANKNGNQ